MQPCHRGTPGSAGRGNTDALFASEVQSWVQIWPTYR